MCSYYFAIGCGRLQSWMGRPQGQRSMRRPWPVGIGFAFDVGGAGCYQSVAVCGEICSEPLYTLLLLGMGLRELSLVPSAIPEIKKVIRSVTMERAKEVAQTAISMSNARETERFLHASLRQILPMIF